MKTIFQTPTLIDVTAFTVFGVNAKPNTDNPIGHFGTGLKYAIAVLLREKLKVQLFIGAVEYEFYTKDTDFRGKSFARIMMKKRKGLLARWTYETLPFTTELGKGWKLWQVFRELYTNTIDEKGHVDCFETDSNIDTSEGTTFIITGDEFAQEYAERAKNFLTSAGKAWDGKTLVEVVKEPNKHVFWRGMRVYDMYKDQQSLYTYNIWKPMELTEDRTLKYTFYMHQAIAEHVARSDDYPMIRNVVTAKEGFESTIDWTMVGVVPGETFNKVMKDLKGRGSYIGSGPYGYYGAYTRDITPKETWKTIAAIHIDQKEWDAAVEILAENQTNLARILRGLREIDDVQSAPVRSKIVQPKADDLPF